MGNGNIISYDFFPFIVSLSPFYLILNKSFGFTFVSVNRDLTGSPVGQFESISGLKLYSNTLISQSFEFVTGADTIIEYSGGDATFNNGSGTNPGWVEIAEMTSYTEQDVTPPGPGVQPIPEPSTMLLMGTGLVALFGLGRKKLFKK